MYRFEIWAPLAEKMSVQVDGNTLPMEGPDSRGWWRLNVAEAGPGSDYGFLIDDDPQPYADPRSQWQPKGVHGLSRVYDQAAFSWTVDRLNTTKFQSPPLASAIIYELHIGTFTPQGTLDAAIEKLNYLVELGITHIELMPVATFAGDRGWGYDGVALFAVHQDYGGPDALKRFVDAAHQHGLAVLLDVVYNHFGPVGNYAGKYAPYLVDTHHTAWGGAVNLEGPGSHEVRRFFCDNALMWLRDFHIDGLRLDAVHALIDRSAIHFLEQLSTEVEKLEAASGRRLVLIAESDLNDPATVTPRSAGGVGMTAQWSDDFHHALFTVLNPGPTEGYYADFGSLAQLAKALQNTFVYDGAFSEFREREHGRSAANVSQHRFLGYIQNHDQIGNRAVGDRIAEVVGPARARIAAAVVLLAPFIPMLFQGEEWAASSPFQYFADHEDPEMARLVSEGRRKEFAAFGWDPKSIPDPENRETFQRSKLNWSEVESGEHLEMLNWHKQLIQLRRSTPDLNDGEPGNTQVVFNEEDKTFIVQRGKISLNCNLGEREQRTSVAAGSQLLLASCDCVRIEGAELILPPDTVAVLGESADLSQ